MSETTDNEIIKEALENPYKMLELYQGYTVFKQTQFALIISMETYFQSITNANKNPQQNTTVDAIKWLHMLFNILYLFELKTDCNDLRNMDCIILRDLLGVYKRTGYYEAYRKYAQVLQVKREVPLQQEGGMRGIVSMLYIILIFTWTLGQLQGIHINWKSAYDRQLSSDYYQYKGDNSEIENTKMQYNYLTKLSSMFNNFGSCVWQSIAIGVNPERITNKLEKKHGELLLEGTNIGSAIVFGFPSEKIENKRMLDYNYLSDIKTEGAHTYKTIVDFYNLKKSYAKGEFSDPNNFNLASNKHFINTVKSELHLIDIVNTETEAFNFDNEPLIISFTAGYYVNFYDVGHAFTILYNSHTGKICVFDFNNFSNLNQNYKLQTKHFLYEHAKYDNDIPLPIIYFAEPGFWDNTEFSTLPLFEQVNKYGDDPINDYLTVAYRLATRGTESDTSVKLLLHSKILTLELDVLYNSPRSSVKNSFLDNLYSNLGLQDSHAKNPYKFNNFHGWGCASLNNCNDSQVALLKSYVNLLKIANETYHNNYLTPAYNKDLIDKTINHIPKELDKYFSGKTPQINAIGNAAGNATVGGSGRRKTNKRRRRRYKTKHTKCRRKR